MCFLILNFLVAKLYNDLDRGLTPLNVFFEHLPLPRYWARDAANAKLTSLFLSIMEKRRQAAATTTSSNKQGGQEEEEKKFDVLEALMKSCYRNGNPLSDVAVAHLMIALLMAGQHTSSTTSTWMLFRLAQNPQLQ